MIQMNLSTKQSHRCGKQTYGYQGVREGRDKPGDWDRHMYTTIYYHFWITNKDLLYSTGNSTHTLMAYMERNLKSVDMYVCIIDSFCCTPATNTAL